MSNKEAPPQPDFVELHARYRRIAESDGDFRSQLGKRVGSPEELGLRPAFYKLFPGVRPPSWAERVVFFLPFCPHAKGAKSLGEQLASHGVREARLFQVVRAEPPNDLIQLRRLVQHVNPVVDWADFGRLLYFWNDRSKRTLLEDFFIHQRPAKVQ
nr:type I-E CRISPR-associated protein Cse2/CasB [uncultured Caldimonas sp.]